MTASILDQIKSSELGKSEFTPYLQVLHAKSQDPEDFGMYITKEQADRIGFKPDNRWSEHSHLFNNQKVPTPGYISQNPRLILVRSGGLAMFYNETGKFAGYYDNDRYLNDKKNFTLRTRYIVYLVGEDMELLHNEPLQWTSKGSFGAAFGQTLGKYRKAFSSFIQQQRRGEFWSYVVFDFQVRPEEKGYGSNKITLADVKGFVYPNDKTIHTLYAGLHETTASKIAEVYKQFEGFKTYTIKDVDPSDVTYPEEHDYPATEPATTAYAQEWRKKFNSAVESTDPIPAAVEKEARDSIGQQVPTVRSTQPVEDDIDNVIPF